MFAHDFSKEECARSGLFVPQRDNRSNAHGAARGNVAGKKRDTEEHDGDGGERHRVTAADSVEQLGKAGEQADEHQRGGCSDGDADESQPQTLANDEPENVTLLRAEGHANAHFVGALANGVRSDAVEADARERRASAANEPSSIMAKRRGASEDWMI